jgi:hypothetical protein
LTSACGAAWSLVGPLDRLAATLGAMSSTLALKTRCLVLAWGKRIRGWG